MNGDILTNLEYNQLMQFHREQDASMSIAMYDKEVKINLGTIKTNGNNVIYDYIEKPTLTYQASMGIYVFSKSVLDFIPKNEYFDIPSLVKLLIEKKSKVAGFHFNDYWRDIGRKEDYELAMDEYDSLRDELLKNSQ
jgi:NDP-sugar pyrophosphorylase family protein